ncbi:hypothetical protein GMST_20050 [Geomonas silvestris]|uniref:Uncharacterized protein n=1 Tax=Geomonas silvestris TaxID=2740184 RepID=A0A6V8MI40_9BACT|nr:hypothetical protein [Geomonas silvestris]GFO59680.1 hypothetical protein GMST_20050 [Geomonas silvestris]
MARWVGFAIWISLTLLLAAVAGTQETAPPAAPGTAGTKETPEVRNSGQAASGGARQLSRRNQVRVKVDEAGKTRRDLIEKANPDGSIKK